MKRLTVTALALVVAMTGVPALAQGKAGCPPGLAKKSVPCVPPGQAKKGVRYDADRGEYYRLRVGDRYDHDRYRYDRVRDWDALGLPPIGGNEGYYRDGHIVYRIDRETRQILALYELARILGGG